MGRHMRGLAAAAGLLGVLAGSAAAQDPLEVGPDVYSKKFENERVRVMEVDFKVGDSIAMHSHPDHFVYVLTPGTLRLTHPDGQSKDVVATAGEVLWLPAESHAAENTGGTEVRLLVVELK
jgi:quercetin dioxygenase-like cupin family protein